MTTTIRTLALPLILAALPGCTGCGDGYSEGDRTGTISKLSRKGITFKSWEGEMVLGGVRAGENGSAVANVWRFHVPDHLAAKVQAAQTKGAAVTLHYRQWMVPPIDQDSEYDVTAIVEVK